MTDFLKDIDELRELDELRDEAISLRNESLESLTTSDYENDSDWDEAGDKVETALCLRVIFSAKMHGLKLGQNGKVNRKYWLENKARGVNSINIINRSIKKNLAMGADDSVPLLRSARGLQALVVTPGKKFRALFACLYNVVVEISYAGPTEWLFGGARAGVAAPTSAFITAECIRGLLNLQRGLEYSKRICNAIASFQKRKDLLKEGLAGDALKPWRDQDLKRILLSLEIEFSDLLKGAFIPNRDETEILKGEGLTEDNIADRLLQIQNAIRTDVILALSACNSLVKSIKNRRKKDEERKDFKDAESAEQHAKEFDNTESAHRHAKWLIEDSFCNSLQKIFQELEKSKGKLLGSEGWERLAKIFSRSEEDLQDEVRGPSLYMETVLEAELARASGKDGAFDVCQLAFAAASFAVLKKIGPEQRDDRLERAAKLIGAQVDENGGIPSGRPVLTLPKGYEMHVVVPEIIRVFGELLTRVSAPVTSDLVRRLIRYFRNTKIKLGNSERIGFGFDEQKHLPKAFWWLTALSFMALHRVVRMLDCCINERIRHHFSVKKLSSNSINLDSFFYPDYGLATHLPDKAGREPISQLLLKFHAHLNRVRLPFNPPFSAILYGPPGTGKTTMLEALAKTANKPLFEITPSDILVGGAEMVEQRARAVFNALGMLTDAIILFDEFDPLIRQRDKKRGVPQVVFEFLTPGLLPKIKNLHERSKKQRIVYCLATNMVGTLDTAAIREGRFDKKLGIYPPDLLSRAGRLVECLGGISFLSDSPKRKKFAQCIAGAAGRAMARLGLPGWFSKSREEGNPEVGTPDWYVTKGELDRDAPQFPDPEEICPRVPKPLTKDSITEWSEWKWIENWDKKSSSNWDALLKALASGEKLPFPKPTVKKKAVKTKSSGSK